MRFTAFHERASRNGELHLEVGIGESDEARKHESRGGQHIGRAGNLESEGNRPILFKVSRSATKKFFLSLNNSGWQPYHGNCEIFLLMDDGA